MKKFLVRLLCCFVPGRETRHKVRDYFFKYENKLENLQNKLSDIATNMSAVKENIFVLKQNCEKSTDIVSNLLNSEKHIDLDVIIDEKENAVFRSSVYNTNDCIIRLNNNVFCLYKNNIAAGTVMGKYSYIGEHTKIDRNVKIGAYCSISDNVLIGATIHPQNWLSTSPFQYDTWLDEGCKKIPWTIEKETVVGNDVWIGAHVIIKSGVRIGNGAIIGAGAVVTHDVPDYAVVAGVPARVIKYRFSPAVIKKLLSLQWWNLPHEQIQKLSFNDIKQCLKELEK